MSEPTKPAKPQRACVFTTKIEADNRQEMVSALYFLADRLDRGELNVGVSGGCGSGCAYEYLEGDHPTHEEYFAQLHAYLAERKRT